MTGVGDVTPVVAIVNVAVMPPAGIVTGADGVARLLELASEIVAPVAGAGEASVATAVTGRPLVASDGSSTSEAKPSEAGIVRPESADCRGKGWPSVAVSVNASPTRPSTGIEKLPAAIGGVVKTVGSAAFVS